MGTRDKLKNANQAAMNAMNAVDNTLEQFSASKIDNNNVSENKIESPASIIDEAPVKTEEKKNPTGRPVKYKEPITRMSISLSESKKQKVDIATLFYGGSVTDYINALIDRDLQENYEQYEAQKAIIDKFQKK